MIKGMERIDIYNAQYEKLNYTKERHELEQGEASDTGFNVFKNYHDDFYKRCIEFVDGKPILKKVEDNNSN